ALVDRLLADPDAKVAELATRELAARSRQGREALVTLLSRWDPFGGQRARRLQALRALAALGDPEVLPKLRRCFRAGLFGAGTEERRAAFASLAGYPATARRPLLEKGLRDSDGEIRSTCRRLLATPDEGVQP
ncbi:MAG TPA: HEAT repeat domain-containing protein, partial [Thermoanaerobaculia bacterium]|nr:HEAT repeat domain-containing protein [Thermoanaerobaculia bacterium]